MNKYLQWLIVLGFLLQSPPSLCQSLSQSLAEEFGMDIPATKEHEEALSLGEDAYMRGDYARAAYLLLPVAEGGHTVAQMIMGLLYMDGTGVRANPAKAVEMYRRSAEQGHWGGQYFLGRSYLEGRGVPQNFVLAHMWFNLAASRADGEKERAGILEKRDFVAKIMTPTQIEDAQRRGMEWRPHKERPSVTGQSIHRKNEP